MAASFQPPQPRKEQQRGRRRVRRIGRVCLVLLLASIAGVLMIAGVQWTCRVLKTRWLKSDSGKAYTPGEAAKKVIEKIKE